MQDEANSHFPAAEKTSVTAAFQPKGLAAGGNDLTIKGCLNDERMLRAGMLTARQAHNARLRMDQKVPTE